jgi:hypothetical protein
MNKSIISILEDKNYKFACYRFEKGVDRMIKMELVGYITSKSRSVPTVTKQARRILEQRIDHVELVSIIKKTKQLRRSDERIKELVRQYGEIVESEEFVNE